MPDINSAEYWDAIYQSGRPGWDLGRATPVFERLLHSGQFPPGRMIVLGAGRGHDARLFARHGFNVTATDFAAEAAESMRALAEPEAPVEILQADIFALPADFESAFDYLLEYTCFCAIDPVRRVTYAEQVDCLLKPGGRLIALLFPVSGHAGGPPFAVNPDGYANLFTGRGFVSLQREVPPDSVPSRRGIEELVILRKGLGP